MLPIFLNIYSTNASTTLYALWEIKKIVFTINGDSYQAEAGMTWSEWFASSYNTTGKTKGTIYDSSGTEVDLSEVIVGGADYEVEFILVATIIFDVCGENNDNLVTLSLDGTSITDDVKINGTNKYKVQNGAIIKFGMKGTFFGNATIEVNGSEVASANSTTWGSYEYVVTSDVTISITTIFKASITITTS